MTAVTDGAASARRRTSSIVLLVVGALLFLCGPVIGLLVATTTGISSALTDLDSQVRFESAVTIQGEAAGAYFVYTSAHALPPAEACTALDGDREVVLFDAPREQNTNIGWERFESFARFEVPSNSHVVVTCEPKGEYVLGAAFDEANFWGGMFGWPLAGGGLVMVLGFAAVVVGLVRYPWQPSGPQRSSAA